MGLLDSVIGALGTPQGQPGGGGQGALLGALIAMLGQGGGLGSLIDKFRQGGLGEVADSWVSTGPNQPVSPDQLGGVLGNDTIADMARQLGLNSNDLLGQLSQVLPQVVDKLTPDGRLPPPGEPGSGGVGDLAGMLGGLLRR